MVIGPMHSAFLSPLSGDIQDRANRGGLSFMDDPFMGTLEVGIAW
jgi:hypothetical protein